MFALEYAELADSVPIGFKESAARRSAAMCIKAARFYKLHINIMRAICKNWLFTNAIYMSNLREGSPLWLLWRANNRCDGVEESCPFFVFSLKNKFVFAWPAWCTNTWKIINSFIEKWCLLCAVCVCGFNLFKRSIVYHQNITSKLHSVTWWWCEKLAYMRNIPKEFLFLNCFVCVQNIRLDPLFISYWLIYVKKRHAV